MRKTLFIVKHGPFRTYTSFVGEGNAQQESDVPNIRPYYRTLLQMPSSINVVLCQLVRKTLITPSVSREKISLKRIHLPKGTAGFHRRSSSTIALTYGRLVRSAKAGRRCQFTPTTESTSACARACISGCKHIANMKEAREEGVCQAHEKQLQMQALKAYRVCTT